jgi:hypothetical protein
MDRRDFDRLAAAVLAGLLAGANVASAQVEKKGKRRKKKDTRKSMWLQEPHICRGLNTCKGLGRGRKNECAGKGTCAISNFHSCHGGNDCAGLGGCGSHPGENKCKGQGACAVPLMDKTWVRARNKFEAAMTKADKEFGPAPKKRGKK